MGISNTGESGNTRSANTLGAYCDFSFRGETLGDHGYVLCDFNGQSAAGVVVTDSQRTFTQMSMFGGKRFPFLYYRYDSALVIKTDICRRDDSDLTITPVEAARMKKWLESPYPQELRLGGADFAGYFWVGTFNVEEVRLNDECIGFSLTFTADAPFGYKERVTLAGNAGSSEDVIIDDISDEEGYIYPDMSITLNEDGDLTIINEFDNRTTVIKDCTSGETITFTSYLQVLSSKENSNIGHRFNYIFPRINNTYMSTTNTLKFNLSCSYSISYKPIAKVVFS